MYNLLIEGQGEDAEIELSNNNNRITIRFSDFDGGMTEFRGNRL